jgi:hypothetical protein
MSPFVGLVLGVAALALAGFPQPAARAGSDTAPPTGTVVINSNRSATNTPNVTLALTWDDGAGGSGVSRMRFSNDGATWSAWEALAAARAYALPGGDGYKTVRVQYLDKANNRSAVFSDFIRLDATPPTGAIIINGGAATTLIRPVTLALTWSDGTGTGVTRMRLSDNGSTWTAWMPPAAARAHTLPAGLGNHTVRAQYLDGANNYSAVFSDYIKLVAPDPHLSVIAEDKDSDYLSDAEEKELVLDPANPDEDKNGVPDGADLARELASSIGKMPWFNSAGGPENGLNPPELAGQFPTDRPYVIQFDYQVDCVWTCPVCQQAHPVGELRIVNPAVHAGWRDGLAMPLSAWHFLQHRSFGYPAAGCGNTGGGRVDVPDLVAVVTATPANMKASQWIACGAEPMAWGVEILPLGGPLNGIRIAGPTAQYGNDCEGGAGLGGKPHVAVDPDARTLTLVALGPVTGACPLNYDPVCGLETLIIGIANGAWTFRAPILNPPVEFTFDL